MQLGLKFLLEDSNDYEIVTAAMRSRLIDEIAYCDYYYDFPFSDLAGEEAVLRLRIRLDNSAPIASSLHGSTNVLINTPQLTPQRNGGAWYPSPRGGDVGHLPPSYAAFMDSCTDTPSSDQGAPIVPEGATGELVFKGHNSVMEGHQMAFVVKEDSVPASVVAQMMESGANVFDVLVDYAQKKKASPDHNVTGIQSIVKHLSEVASRYAPPRTIPTDVCGTASQEDGCPPESLSKENDDISCYNQMRYASGSKGKISAAVLSQEQNQVGVFLFLVGSCSTMRKTYTFLNRVGSDKLPTEEKKLRDQLRIRADEVVFPFGKRYELEVVAPIVPLDDIRRELHTYLKSLNVKHSDGSESKYVRFVRGMQGMLAAAHDVQDLKICITGRSGYDELKKNLMGISLTGKPCEVYGTNTSEEIYDSHSEPQISNTNLEANSVTRNTVASGDSFATDEIHENFFFDSPNHELHQRNCFLRLRRFDKKERYVLVLKEKQYVVDGQQHNISRQMDLSADVAKMLLTDPTQFLLSQHKCNAVADALCNTFFLRELCRIATFTTYRLCIPWWSSKAQNPSYRPKHFGTQTGGATSRQAFISSQRQTSMQPCVPCLMFHLDRTVYNLSPLDGSVSLDVPPPLQRRRNDEQANEVELYELEVAGIVTAQTTVVRAELGAILDSMCVEWCGGELSKLDRYLCLVANHETAASRTGTTIQ